MRPILYLLAVLAPIAATIFMFQAIPPASAGDCLAYIVVGAMAVCCGVAFVLPSRDDEDHEIDVPEVLKVLPPAEPDDAWGDTENTLCLPRHWMEEGR